MREKGASEIEDLQARISYLEKIEAQHQEAEEELRAINQQLDASNQQLQASEQQLKATNKKLQASKKEIKAKEIESQSAREFAENIIDTVRQPLLVMDMNLRIVTANRYFYKVFQVTKNETKDRLFYEIGNKQWNIPRLKELLKNTLPGKTTVDDFEVAHDFENIGYKIMLLNARELSQKKGKERLILLAIEDITSQRESRKELKRLNAELEKKAAELQQILYITTHDLRSPLVNIQGFTKEMEASINELKDLLSNVPAESKVREVYARIMEEEIPESIHYITSSTTKMDNLLKGLLTLSRLGRQKLSFRKLDMNQLMQEVLDNYKFEINKNEVELKCEELPACTGDELQINQLFSNLIGNALKFFDPDRKGEIKISGKRDKNGSTYTVEDNGIGVSHEYKDKIFGLFEKLNPHRPGIGLGLNLVKQIVEKHNGTIHMKSKLGKGTKFTVFIP